MAPPQLFAARLNAFKIGAESYWPGKNQITTIDVLERANSAGLNTADLNYPDHFEAHTPGELSAAMNTMGITLNGLAMRYCMSATERSREEWSSVMHLLNSQHKRALPCPEPEVDS